MAKGSVFWGYARGKLGTVVLTGRHGEEIVVSYHPKVLNPKTMAQMNTRARMAQCVKFYKRSPKELFQFAFEDKKKYESYNNAFTRYNAMQSCLITRYLYERNACFPFTDGYFMARGTLGYFPLLDLGDRMALPFSIGEGDPETRTIGELLPVLSAGMGLRVGDRITTIVIQMGVDALHPPLPAKFHWPKFIVFSFTLGNDDKKKINRYTGFEVSRNGSLLLSPGPSYNCNYPFYAAVVASRQTKGKLLVTDSPLWPNTSCRRFLEYFKTPEYERMCLFTWHAKFPDIFKMRI